MIPLELSKLGTLEYVAIVGEYPALAGNETGGVNVVTGYHPDFNAGGAAHPDSRGHLLSDGVLDANNALKNHSVESWLLFE